MKRKPIQGLLAAVLLVGTLWGGTPALASSVGTEVKINSGQPEVAKTGFDISNNYAVWIVEGEKTVTLYDLKKGTETKIGDKKSDKSNPKVDGNYVVWTDSRNGDYDVYLYDISRDKEKRITAKPTAGSDVEISGKYVVWTDSRHKGTDIYLYNINTDEETRVTTSGEASKPSVSSYYVAWEDRRNGNSDIFYYDIADGTEHEADVSVGQQTNPVIDSDTILYENPRGEQLYKFSIDTGRSKKVTTDSSSKTNPHLYDDTYIFASGNSLMLGDIDKSSTERIASRIYSRLQPRIYGDLVLYASQDNEGKVRLNMYDLRDEEVVDLGGFAGDPSDPDGSDRYVVYLSTTKRTSTVILYDVEKGTTVAISDEDADPVRPLVSNRYAVWYDKSLKALMAYDIRKGKVTRVTDKSVKPAKNYYELDDNNLLWVNEDRRNELMVTNLSSGKEEDIDRLGKEPLSLDIYGDYITWVLEDSRDKATVYLYDRDINRSTKIVSGVQVEKASIGDNFVVWSQYTSGRDASWDIFYYDIKRSKINPLSRWDSGDQVDPQASRNMVLFYDNRLSPKPKDFYYELFDVEKDSFSKHYWNDKAKMETPRIGGNRVVWIDTRDGDPFVYTLAFASARDDGDDGDDDGDDDGGSDHGDYVEYPFLTALEGDVFFDILDKYGFDSIAFVVFPGTKKEKSVTFLEALDDDDLLFDLLDEADFSDIYVRAYK